MSRDLSEYFEGVLDFIKDDPSIFLHAFTFADRNVSVRKIENDFSAIYGHTLHDEIAALRLDLLRKALRSSNEPAATPRKSYGLRYRRQWHSP